MGHEGVLEEKVKIYANGQIPQIFFWHNLRNVSEAYLDDSHVNIVSPLGFFFLVQITWLRRFGFHSRFRLDLPFRCLGIDPRFPRPLHGYSEISVALVCGLVGQ